MMSSSELRLLNIGSIERMLRYPKNSYIHAIINEYPGNTVFERLYNFYHNYDIIKKCGCGNQCTFKNTKDGYKDYCVNVKCKYDNRTKKTQLTNLERYGVDNPAKLDITKNKTKQTCLERYGASSNLHKNSNALQNVKSGLIKKYGVDSPLKCKEILNKRNQTCADKHGTTNFIQSDKTKATNITRYGYENAMNNKEIQFRNSISNTKTANAEFTTKLSLYGKEISLYKNSASYTCLTCNNIITSTRQFINRRIFISEHPCTVCNPVNYSRNTSVAEKEIQEFICTLYKGIVKTNDKTIIPPFEIDITIPELKLGFEFNGVYWHSELYKDNNYHINKTLKANENGYDLIHIWEDDWIYKKEIIKSKISHLLGKSAKIGARKCKIQKLTNKEAKPFLIDNHIAGYVPATYNYGLFYKDELVQLLTIGKKRMMIGTTDGYELLRSCAKKYVSVSGGFSKLLKFAFNDMKEVNKITTYCDISYTTRADTYLKCGAEYHGTTGPNYFYVVDGMKSNRLNWSKQKLIKLGYDSFKTERQITTELGMYRLYDCGSKSYVIHKP